MLRWTLISDGDHRTYLCPADRAVEAKAALEAIIEFWNDPLRYRSSEGCPEDPEGLIEIEGAELTFECPLINGRPPASFE